MHPIHSLYYTHAQLVGPFTHTPHFSAMRPAVPEMRKSVRTCALADAPHPWFVEKAYLMGLKPQCKFQRNANFLPAVPKARKMGARVRTCKCTLS